VAAWQLQDAKARFSKVFDLAVRGKPQVVTRHGKDAVVVVSQAQYEAIRKPEPTLVSFLLKSPLVASGIEIPHSHERYVPRVDFTDGRDD
jgi:antitoxin Phd